MSEFDVSDIVYDMADQTIAILTATTTTLDFEPTTDTTTVPPVLAVAIVQPANPSDLKNIPVDWSLGYIRIMTRSEVNNGQFVSWHGRNYKIITSSDFLDYGYSDVIGEEVKGNIR